MDEDANNGIRNNLATTSSGALPEGFHATEVGIGMGQAQLQDIEELKKSGEEKAQGNR